MIILTGGAGFIGTNVLMGLNKIGKKDILIVDNINVTNKWRHLVEQTFDDYVHKDSFWSWLEEDHKTKIEAVIHLGACSDTTENDFDYFMENNVRYSQKLWQLCSERSIPFIYASSAATYGDGSKGFSDDHHAIPNLIPINAYGFSKHLFDLWALKQKSVPPRWVGLKFFNVYGPHEDHKGKMASVIYHAFPQARDNAKIRLFKSYKPEYGDGEQKRDFIYVKDVVDVILFLLENEVPSGIYNVGTGQAKSFNDLAKAIFRSMGLETRIEYFEMPEQLRPRYQYFTEAEIHKLRRAGYKKPFTKLENGVTEYMSFLKLG